MSYNWTVDSVFRSDTSHVKPADIFKAFCFELGHYFQEKGWTYRKSKPLLIFEDNEVRIEIGFNSSRSNTAGQWVCVELGVNIYWLELLKQRKSKGQKNYGGVIGDMSIFSKRLDKEQAGTIIIENVFGEIIKRNEPNSESEFRYNKAFNVYGLTPEKFEKVIAFFETRILNWVTDIRSEEKVKELIINAGSWARGAMNSGNFKAFLELKYPSLIKELEYINTHQQQR